MNNPYDIHSWSRTYREEIAGTMLSVGTLVTRQVKLFAIVTFVLLVALQVAVQAKPAHAYEVHVSIKGAGTVDEDPALTQADKLNPACSTSQTNPMGMVGANCYPGDPDGSYHWGWTVRWKATPAEGYTFVRWQSDGSPKPVICDGANGESTYTEASCQFATFDNLQTRAVFEDWKEPPAPWVGGTFPYATQHASFSFGIPRDPTFKFFECRVTPTVQPFFVPCSSGVSFNPTTDGTYTFEVRAVDWSGNVSSISSRQFILDRTVPSVSIDSGPSAVVNNRSPNFGFSSNDGNATFLCSLDNAHFDRCTSPKSYVVLSDGQHTFQVKATDAAGNTSSTARRTWTVDTTAPETVILSGPSGTVLDNSATFEFWAEPGARYECGLDGSGLEPCSSPKDYTDLAVGFHEFVVRAIDAVGNTETTVALRDWTVKHNDPPMIGPMTPAPGSTIRDRTPLISAIVTDGGTDLTQSEITLKVDGRVRSFAYDTMSDKLVRQSNKLAYGKHTVTITADDGRAETARSWRFKVVKR